MAILHMDSFQKTVLASFIGLCISQPAFALQELSDEGLSQTTGEGIALLPQNTYMIFQGEKNTTTGADLLNRQLDTGYINYVPIGPLSSATTDTNKSGAVDAGDRAVGKADLFLYGLALSASNIERADNHNERVGLNTAGTAINAIRSWGTATNPWILKVQSQANVPTFTPDGSTPNTDTGQVTYMALEAPLYEYYNDNATGTGAPTVIKTGADAAGADAYNLKLGLWADAFVRNPNKANGAIDQFQYGNSAGLVGTGSDIDPNRANRLRLQGIWNGFSLNGSNLKIFQTLNGAGSTGGLSPFYNNTLGLAGVFRLNSGDGADFKATINQEVVQNTTSAWNTIHDGSSATFDPPKPCGSGSSCNNGGGAQTYGGNTSGCSFFIQKRETTQQTRSTWVAPSNLNNKVLRLSTRETADTDRLATPAIQGGNAPTFDANEGIFIYNLNTNLVLGNLYQPVILGSDGKNFSLEVARIPNKESIYKQIYTDYTGADTSYKGSTCNVYQCGANISLGGKTYQGSNATHSSISIGSVYSNDGGKTLQAYKGIDAVGISFGKLNNRTNDLTKVYTEYQYKYRQQSGSLGTWCSSNPVLGICWGSTYNMYDWVYYNGTGTDSTSEGWGGFQKYDRKPVPGNNNPASAGEPTLNNRNWTASGNPAVWMNPNNSAYPTANQRFKDFLGSTYTNNPQSIAPTTPVSAPALSPLNNMGSAVIDGVLIQHLKITTTGL
ncbi:MAG: hypothetical protein LBQ29_04735 [Acinetobacter sp.]|uniref:hypothetical protein n=1 Tax=Acinetobacter sp. TaxID=472 RepID=UPI00282FDDB4|nr:hypothetical protein [Acinetobacter sp.]MDR2060690.1 hypothetical protein [Acinetobacter sp.]